MSNLSDSMDLTLSMIARSKSQQSEKTRVNQSKLSDLTTSQLLFQTGINKKISRHGTQINQRRSHSRLEIYQNPQKFIKEMVLLTEKNKNRNIVKKQQLHSSVNQFKNDFKENYRVEPPWIGINDTHNVLDKEPKSPTIVKPCLNLQIEKLPESKKCLSFAQVIRNEQERQEENTSRLFQLINSQHNQHHKNKENSPEQQKEPNL